MKGFLMPAAVALVLSSSAFAAPFQVVQRQDACAAAFEMCIFGFDGLSSLPTFTLGRPGRPISPAIVYKSDDMDMGVLRLAELDELVARQSGGVDPFNDDIAGSIDKVGESFVVTDSGPIPIRDFECPRQDFTRMFFKATGIAGSSGRPLSAVSHEAFQGDQAECLDGMCVIMTIDKWQSFGDGGVDNLETKPGEEFINCVAFRVEL